MGFRSGTKVNSFASMGSLSCRVARGVAAGIAGTLAVAGADVVEAAILGRAPVYAPRSIARRLLLRRRRRAPDLAYAASFGRLLRWTYGPALGLAAEWLAPRTGNVIGSAFTLGGAVLASELAALPRLGATPPVRTWPLSDIVLLALHTAVFGLAATTVRRIGSHDNGRRSVGSAHVA